MSKQNVPELRFPEFSGEWEEKKLGEISQNAMYGMNTAATDFDGENVYVRITDIEEQSRKLNTKDFTSPSEINDRYLLNEEDILFARTGASTGKSYLHRSLNQNLKYYFAGFLIKFELKGGFNPNFIYPQTLTQKYDKWVKVMSMRSGQPGINGKEYSLLPIHTTSEEEQEKIGEFFNKLDRLIELEEKKLELLEEQKKGYMQKIFSQELRFKDENGNDYPEWEEKKIGEIASFSKGKDISKSDLTNEGEPCVLYGELYTRYKDVINEVHSKTNLPAQFLKVAYKNSVLIPSSGETPIDIAKATAINVRSVLVGGDINILNPINGYLGTFISMIINGRYKKRLSKFSQGKTVVHLYNNDIKKLKIDLPTYEEQKKISSFLEKFNKLIEIRNSKIEQMKNRKKTLLQKMYLS
ncbi:restriction endonuclease subunit S [Salinicoccus kekensis]|nr:restriction endonuclease subunit S [Salinicoccus kekensis]